MLVVALYVPLFTTNRHGNFSIIPPLITNLFWLSIMEPYEAESVTQA